MTSSFPETLLAGTLVFGGVVRLVDVRLYTDEQRSNSPILLPVTTVVWVLAGVLGLAVLLGFGDRLGLGGDDPSLELFYVVLPLVGFDILVQQWLDVDTPPWVALLLTKLRG